MISRYTRALDASHERIRAIIGPGLGSILVPCRVFSALQSL
jgi:hypothetical protein